VNVPVTAVFSFVRLYLLPETEKELSCDTECAWNSYLLKTMLLKGYSCSQKLSQLSTNKTECSWNSYPVIKLQRSQITGNTEWAQLQIKLHGTSSLDTLNFTRRNTISDKLHS
jgi:hypothetical protein